LSLASSMKLSSLNSRVRSWSPHCECWRPSAIPTHRKSTATFRFELIFVRLARTDHHLLDDHVRRKADAEQRAFGNVFGLQHSGPGGGVRGLRPFVQEGRVDIAGKYGAGAAFGEARFPASDTMLMMTPCLRDRIWGRKACTQ